MKITVAYLNNWFPMYQDYFFKAHGEWINSHFKDCAPPHTPSIASPIKIVEWTRYIKVGMFSWQEVPELTRLYPYNDAPDWLNPYEVNYSCTYDHSNLFRMRSHTYRIRSKYLRK